jgi:octaprenyl-diphosphate synthase
VLLGDFLYARLAPRRGSPSRPCSTLLAETTRTLCVGEIEQSTRRYDFEMSPLAYESIASGQDREPVRGGPRARRRATRAATRELGRRPARPERRLAFQIVDDCLDLTANQDEVGKSVGTDVEDGKVTLPVLFAYQAASERTRAAIRDAYTRPDVADRRAALLAACDVEAGVAAAHARARALLDEALAILGGLPVSKARQSMERLFHFVLERNQ